MKGYFEVHNFRISIKFGLEREWKGLGVDVYFNNEGEALGL